MKALILVTALIAFMSPSQSRAVDVYIKQIVISPNITTLDSAAVDEQIVKDFSVSDKNVWVGSLSDAQIILVPTLAKVGDDFHLTIAVMKGDFQIKKVNASFHSSTRLPYASAKALKFALSREVVRQATPVEQSASQVVATAN